jgi:hypothetical protein
MKGNRKIRPYGENNPKKLKRNMIECVQKSPRNEMGWPCDNRGPRAVCAAMCGVQEFPWMAAECVVSTILWA